MGARLRGGGRRQNDLHVFGGLGPTCRVDGMLRARPPWRGPAAREWDACSRAGRRVLRLFGHLGRAGTGLFGLLHAGAGLARVQRAAS